VKLRVVARRIFDALERHYPDADTELAYRTPFELLVATILSAQSTDQRVNQVTPALFAKYPDAKALAAANPEDIEPVILSTGFFRQKSRSIVAMAQALVERHSGEVPADMAALVKLTGVGRKTANVVLGHALGVPGLPVDRHVLRVSNRLGLAHGDDPVKVETTLCEVFPPERWTKASDLLILHGRRICRPKPLCSRCNARKDCDFFSRNAPAQAGALEPTGRARASARAAAKPNAPAKAGALTANTPVRVRASARAGKKSK
jgi:endonuclease-3